MRFPLKSRKLIRGLQAHVDAGLGGAVDYSASYEPLFLPFDGEVSFFSGVQGGNWLRLKRDGETWEFAHLDRYLVQPGFHKEGTEAAVTGNTGQVTSGPHLHLQIFGENGRIDPEKYFMFKFHFTTVNGDGELLKETQKLVDLYSNGQIQLTWTDIWRPVYDDILIDVEAFPILKELEINNPSILFYNSTSPSVWAATWMYGKNPMILADSRITPFNLCFEIAHAIQKFYNEYRGANPGVTIDDIYTPTEDLIKSKFATVIPYISYLNNMGATEQVMNETEVKAAQLLEGYQDSSGQKYWGDGVKTLRQYLIARLEDKIKDLQTVLAELKK